jgi:signal transduction histidine kinase
MMEMTISHPVPCVSKFHNEKLCWLSTLASGDSKAAMQDDLLICNECATFKEIINRGFGRRTADVALGTTVAKLLGQVYERNLKLDEARLELEKKVAQLALMKVITDAVVKTTDLRRALKIILTGVTSGQAFGFNRACIFLVDARNEYLEGMDAVGPENWEAASRIWSELQAITFEQQIRQILDSQTLAEDSLTRQIAIIKIPLTESSHFLVKALWAEKPTFLRKSEMEPGVVAKILKRIDFNEFAAVPLQAEGLPLGLMIADNFYTNKPITEASMDALETLANTCTNVLENTLLHKQLSQRLEELERVNRLLRENQSYLLQAERLADMGRLAATVAHEFKTPLVTIGGHARRAMRDLNTTKFRKKDLEIIISEIGRLEKISSEILEYSRPSKFDITKRKINDLVKESLELLEHRLSLTRISLKSKFIESNPLVAVDEKKFKQVLLNTVDNAIDAMASGMILRVETNIADGNAVIEIIDTGTGISEEITDKIFTPFFTTKSRGSGLGLSVSKKIVEDHGGFMEFESKLGEGTKFSIHFPIAYR